MKRSKLSAGLLLFFLSLFFLPSCEEKLADSCVGCSVPNCITLKLRYVLSYIELKSGMTIVPRVFNNTIDLSLLTADTDYIQKIHINTSLPEQSYLYPAKVSYTRETFLKPFYKEIYSTAPFETMCQALSNDSVSSQFCSLLSLGGGIINESSYMENMPTSCLYNQLDSIKIVCTDPDLPIGHPFSGDTLANFWTLYVRKVFYPKEAIPYGYTGGVNMPLSDFFNQLGKTNNKGRISVYNIPNRLYIHIDDGTPSTYRLRSMYLTFNQDKFTGDFAKTKRSYHFKVYFYMDAGKLVVPSAEVSLEL